MKALIGIGLALALAGCASTGSVGGGANQQVKDIQAAIKLGCNFVPTVQTIISLINASAGSTLGIVNEVCMAITSVPLADGGRRKVIVRGVPIAGRRV